jgi:hypothetical protein
VEKVILPRKPVVGFVKERHENGRNAKQVCAAIKPPLWLLADALRRLQKANIELESASDHGVS